MGTVLVKDINPDVTYDSDPSSLTDVGGALFFAADDGTRGSELWKSDGTEAGTVLVKDINPHDNDPILRRTTCLTAVGARYFSPPMTASAVASCGSRTALRRARCWSRTSMPAAAFTVPEKGTANFSKGTMRVKVKVTAAGRLEVGPTQGARLRRSVTEVAHAGTVTVTLRPTKAGLRTLEKVGRLRVEARFTFAPCGGVGTSATRHYTLKMR